MYAATYIALFLPDSNKYFFICLVPYIPFCLYYPVNIRLVEDVLKTSFVFVFRRRLNQDEYVRLKPYIFRRRLQDVLVKTNIFVLAIRLQDVFKTSCQDIFKTFSRRLQGSCKNVFKTSSRRLQDVFKTSSRHLQDVFKTYYQVKVFFVKQFQDIFETYSKRF